MPVAEVAVAERFFLWGIGAGVVGCGAFAHFGGGLGFTRTEEGDDAVLGDSFWAGLLWHTDISSVYVEFSLPGLYRCQHKMFKLFRLSTDLLDLYPLRRDRWGVKTVFSGGFLNALIFSQASQF